MAHPASSKSRQSIETNSPSIASRENRWLKRFRAALRGERGDDGIVGVEGVRLVEAALGSKLRVEAVLVSETGARHIPRLAPWLAPAVPLLRTSDSLFAGVADTKTPQGIAALVRPRLATIEEMLPGTALIVVLVGVQDPGNVGTIIRAAEAFGATGAVTCIAGGMGTADPFAPKALRASAGSALRLAVLREISTAALLSQMRSSRVKVYAAVSSASGNADASAAQQHRNKPSGTSLLCPWDIDWNIPAAILIGNEGSGLPEELVSAADARVYIPQAAATAPVGIESLNAAMAASVLLYEAMRQRNSASRKCL